MNPILVKHGGKIIFGVSLVACGAVWATYLSQQDPQEFAQLESDRKRLAEALSANQVSPNYQYSAEKLKYAQTITRNASRLDGVCDQAMAYALFSKPNKQSIDPTTI